MNSSLVILSPHVLSPYGPANLVLWFLVYRWLIWGETEARNGYSFEGGGDCAYKMAYASG